MVRFQRWFTPWVLVAPALAWLLVFSVWPSINTVRLSFTDAKPLGGNVDWVGARNYTDLIHDSQVWSALLNSVVYTVVCLPLLTVLPLMLAVLVERKLPGIAFFRTAYYVPVIASAVVVGLMWTWLLDDRGLINNVARALHILEHPLPFLTDRWLVVFSAISLTVWKGLGYYMIVYLAALANVRRELHEAAAMDGAGAWQRFRFVTWPNLRYLTVVATTLDIINTIRHYDIIGVMTGGGPAGGTEVLPVLLYNLAFRSNRFGEASATGVLLLVLVLAFAVVYVKLAKLDRADGG